MTVRVRFSQASRSARRYLITLEVIFRKGSWRVFRQSLNVLGSTVKISAACASVRSSAAGFAAAFCVEYFFPMPAKILDVSQGGVSRAACKR